MRTSLYAHMHNSASD